ncbi:MAG: NifU family protein [Proteobacteria bacterium]|nr:NifU family protein [Pseudomonadota bacterium]
MTTEFSTDAPTTASSDEARLKLIAETIQSVRPRLQKDGGDIELIAVDGLFVRVRLSGACVSCTLAGQTLGGVRRELMAALNEPVRIVPVPID